MKSTFNLLTQKSRVLPCDKMFKQLGQLPVVTSPAIYLSIIKLFLIRFDVLLVGNAMKHKDETQKRIDNLYNT